MSRSQVEIITSTYEYELKSTKTLIQDLPESCRMFQVKDGGSHPLWLVGHLAFTLDMFINQWVLGGEGAIPADYGAKFAPDIMGGGPVLSSADEYPAWDSVVENYGNATARTFELLGALEDSELAGDMKGDAPEQARSFFGNIGPSLIGMAVHDAYHRGQIGMLKSIAS